ncbi:iron uptake porin, partial [Phormidesmis sp. 146-33]
MLKVLLNSLLVSPAVLGAALAVSSGAIAAEKQAEVSPLAAIESTAQALESIAPSNVSQPQVKQIASVAAPAGVQVATVESIQPQAPESKISTLSAPAPVQMAQAAPADVSIDQINRYSKEGRTNNTAAAGQVTSVSQLSDVRPTDWAFQALQSLVERYGCIAGYPDKTYRGNRALTRFEFAAGLNACLDRVNELIAAATADLVKKEDLATLQKLQEEFAAELATLRGRVDALEARTTTLEKQQFSTTTKLAGEAIFAVTDEFGVDGTNGNNTVFQNRVRLALNTSFTGKDLLVTRLAAGNATPFT